MADFTATCDNTEKVPVSFQVWNSRGLPARLDATTPPVITASGGGSINMLADTVGTNGFPTYNFEVVSGSLETETIAITGNADGDPGSGLSDLAFTGELLVAPVPATSAAFTVGAAVPK